MHSSIYCQDQYLESGDSGVRPASTQSRFTFLAILGNAPSSSLETNSIMLPMVLAGRRLPKLPPRLTDSV